MVGTIEQKQTRLARDSFLSGDQANLHHVSSRVITSWRRSQLSGVAANSTTVPYAPLHEGANRPLIIASTPVMDRLAHQLPEGTAVILSDTHATILDRRASGGAYSRHLDEVLCIPGSNYSEEAIGTNGIGSVIETSTPIVVAGAEHFRENFQNFTCVGAPIRHPITKKLMGVLAVSSQYNNAHELMTPLLLSASREIESAIYSLASAHDRMMLEEFLKASHRTSAAVVSLNQDFVMTNPAAAMLLDPSDHALLWSWVSESMSNADEASSSIHLHNGRTVRARGRIVGERSRGAMGALLELQLPNPTSHNRKSTRVMSDPELPGRSGPWLRVLAEIETAINSERDVLVLGEPGTGKGRVAERIAGASPVVHEAALVGSDQDWIGRLRNALNGSSPVLVKHIEQLPDIYVPAFAALLRTHHSARLIATADQAVSDGPASRLRDHFEIQIDLPALRQRPEDIRDIATSILRNSDDDNAVRIQPGALRALDSHSWPGNIRELRAVLASARSRSLGGDITQVHLPPAYRQTNGSPLSALRRTERETILGALDDCHGNKLAAAEILGIARSTLYRKMRALDIQG